MHMTSTSVLGRESKIARSNEENWSKGCSWMMYFHLLVKMRNPHRGCILILLSFIANKQDFILRISARAFFWNGPSISDNFNIWCSFEWRSMIRWKAFHTAMLLWDNRQWTVVSILFLNNWVCLSTKGTFKADQP